MAAPRAAATGALLRLAALAGDTPAAVAGAFVLRALDEDELARVADAAAPLERPSQDELRVLHAALARCDAAARRRRKPRVLVDDPRGPWVLHPHGYDVVALGAGVARDVDRGRFRDAADALGRFDALWLRGFHRLFSNEARLAFLLACTRVCPRGPIIIAWRDAPATSATTTRAVAAAARVGGACGALRGVARSARGDRSTRGGGVAHALSAGELEALARKAGLALEDGGGGDAGVRLAILRPGTPVPRRDDVTVDLLVEVLRGRPATIVARGGSMTPAIAHGAKVTLTPLSGATRLQLGDVVAARVDGGLRIHRIVGVDNRGHVLLKGDTSPEPDGWIEPRDVLALAPGVPAPRRVPPRWRRAVGRLRRAGEALAARRLT